MFLAKKKMNKKVLGKEEVYPEHETKGTPTGGVTLSNYISAASATGFMAAVTFFPNLLMWLAYIDVSRIISRQKERECIYVFFYHFELAILGQYLYWTIHENLQMLALKGYVFQLYFLNTLHISPTFLFPTKLLYY